MIRNIIFDMGNVLIYFDRNIFLDRVGLENPEDRELLNREVYLSLEWSRMDRGSLTDEEAAEIIARRVPEHLRETVHRLVNEWERPILPIAGMEELVRELKRNGYGIYLLSNASLAHHDYWPKYPIAGLIEPSRVFISADVRLLKPEPAIYEAFLAKYGLDPADCVFLDDFSLNVLFAREAGMDGIVFFGDVPRLRRELRALGIEISGAEDQ